jgi:hypothetical protein
MKHGSKGEGSDPSRAEEVLEGTKFALEEGMTPENQPSQTARGTSPRDAEAHPRRAANSRPEDQRSDRQDGATGGVDALLRAYPSLVHEIE